MEKPFSHRPQFASAPGPYHICPGSQALPHGVWHRALERMPSASNADIPAKLDTLPRASNGGLKVCHKVCLVRLREENKLWINGILKT